MAAGAAFKFSAVELVHEVRVPDEGARDLQSGEAGVQDFFHLVPGDQSADIDQRHLQRSAELLGLFEEIAFAVGYGRNHQTPSKGDSSLEPPEFLHVHVVAQGLQGHGSAHDLHRGAAHESGGEHEGVRTGLFEFPGDLDAFFGLHALPEAVVHVDLDNHSHVVAGGFHDPVHHQIHEAHAVLETASELVFAAVGVGGEELAYQVAVAGVYLHAVEPGFAGEIHCGAEVVGNLKDFIPAQPAHEGGGVEVESRGGPDRGAAAGRAVGHVSAVAELNGGLGAFGMDGVGELPELGHYFPAHPELGVE